MSYIPGATINDELPAGARPPRAPGLIAEETVAALVALHAADLEASGLGELGRPRATSSGSCAASARCSRPTRPGRCPSSSASPSGSPPTCRRRRRTTFVHGDYRLGNLLFGTPLGVAAVLDWEMATVGDPLADLGYLTAMWAAPDDDENPMFALSRLTRRPDFPRREDLARAYAEATGDRSTTSAGTRSSPSGSRRSSSRAATAASPAGASTDPYFGSLGDGVPALARTALGWTQRLDA